MTHAPLAVTLVHGEGDAPRAQAYKYDLLQMQQDYQNDLNVITGTSRRIPLFIITQNACLPLDMAIAQYQASQMSDDVIIVGPNYHIPHTYDDLHLSGI